jgi:hypothetical protein
MKCGLGGRQCQYLAAPVYDMRCNVSKYNLKQYKKVNAKLHCNRRHFTETGVTVPTVVLTFYNDVCVYVHNI